ncbi:B-box-type zinc finger - like 10 [Theobroma cacao]|nr:B-box-type zinc finger - like 10 [Theobroma cacao]
MKSAGKLCELCQEEAFVYCLADAAFLCWQCDDKVHQANFLVARHLHLSGCKRPTVPPPLFAFKNLVPFSLVGLKLMVEAQMEFTP